MGGELNDISKEVLDRAIRDPQLKKILENISDGKEIFSQNELNLPKQKNKYYGLAIHRCYQYLINPANKIGVGKDIIHTIILGYVPRSKPRNLLLMMIRQQLNQKPFYDFYFTPALKDKIIKEAMSNHYANTNKDVLIYLARLVYLNIVQIILYLANRINVSSGPFGIPTFTATSYMKSDPRMNNIIHSFEEDLKRKPGVSNIFHFYHDDSYKRHNNRNNGSNRNHKTQKKHLNNIKKFRSKIRDFVFDFFGKDDSPDDNINNNKLQDNAIKKELHNPKTLFGLLNSDQELAKFRKRILKEQLHNYGTITPENQQKLYYEYFKAIKRQLINDIDLFYKMIKRYCKKFRFYTLKRKNMPIFLAIEAKIKQNIMPEDGQNNDDNKARIEAQKNDILQITNPKTMIPYPERYIKVLLAQTVYISTANAMYQLQPSQVTIIMPKHKKYDSDYNSSTNSNGSSSNNDTDVENRYISPLKRKRNNNNNNNKNTNENNNNIPYKQQKLGLNIAKKSPFRPPKSPKSPKKNNSNNNVPFPKHKPRSSIGSDFGSNLSSEFGFAMKNTDTEEENPANNPENDGNGYEPDNEDDNNNNNN